MPLTTLLAALALHAPQETAAATILRVDPGLLALAAEVWSVAGGMDNPIWPGWDVTETPLLFYFPGVQDVLVNHPAPPRGFRPYVGPLAFPGWEIAVRNGATEFDLDGQNTAHELAGVQTLVVADPYSSLRQTLLGWAGGATSAREREDTLTYDLLAADPLETMGLIVHEAFHVHQAGFGAGRSSDERALLTYPCLSVDNNVGFALEAEALSAALAARDEDERWIGALRWLALRQDRRSGLSPEAITYEDGTEFKEGLAKYTEWALSYALEGRTPAPATGWVRGFPGYGDMERQRASLLDAMRGFLNGAYVVNGDPYGTAPVRFRLYYSGMAIGALLDGLLPDWKQRMTRTDVTLTGLVQEALQVGDEDLATALVEAHELWRTPALVAEKQELRAAGEAVAREKVAALVSSTDTLLTVDHSAVAPDPGTVDFSYTPFGITRVDAERVLYEQVPIAAQIAAGHRLEQTHASPLLHDAGRGWIQFRLRGRVSPADLAAKLGLRELGPGPLESVRCSLPGVRLEFDAARVEHSGEEIRVVLLGP